VVWLPGNLISNLMVDASAPPQERALSFLLLRTMIELTFGPIYTGGILYILANRMTGRRSHLVEAIQVGIHNWGRLFLARLVANLIIAAGLFAFIVPGIYLAIRYSLLDSVVVLEGCGVNDSRVRSSELVRGKELEIFAGLGIIYLVLLAVIVALQALAESFPLLTNLWFDTLLDCVSDLGKIPGLCFPFAYYWEMQKWRPAMINADD
jgi:hypothetical protein